MSYCRKYAELKRVNELLISPVGWLDVLREPIFVLIKSKEEL